jgi:hypothetical protein
MKQVYSLTSSSSTVFRQMGLQDDAREIAIAKQRAIHKHRQGASRLWSWVLGATIDYGYRPQKVIIRFIFPILLHRRCGVWLGVCKQA